MLPAELDLYYLKAGKIILIFDIFERALSLVE